MEKGLNKLLTLREKFSGILSGLSGVLGSDSDVDNSLNNLFTKM